MGRGVRGGGGLNFSERAEEALSQLTTEATLDDVSQIIHWIGDEPTLAALAHKVIVSGGGSGEGGVTDHGALTGLADDDHSQYHTNARGDARYHLLSTDLATDAELTTGLAGKADASHAHAGEDITSGTIADARIASSIARDSEVTTGLAGKADTSHVHSAADITSGTLDDARIPSGIARDTEVTSAISTHEGAANPHPTYLTQAEADALYEAIGGGGGGLTFDEVWPVGCIFLAVVSTNPATLLGQGTWTQIARDRFLVGQGTDADFDTAEETGGAKTVTLDVTQIPSHTHTQMRLPTATGGVVGFTVDTSMSGTPATSGVVTAATGGGAAHSNVPPYFVIYVWKRTA